MYNTFLSPFPHSLPGPSSSTLSPRSPLTALIALQVTGSALVKSITLVRRGHTVCKPIFHLRMQLHLAFLLFVSLTLVSAASEVYDAKFKSLRLSRRFTPHLLQARQLAGREVCSGPDVTCVSCFGAGYTYCPDGITCYDPSDPTSSCTAGSGGGSGTSDSCAEQYGAGSVSCGTGYCYNPTEGDVCCSDGCKCCFHISHDFEFIRTERGQLSLTLSLAHCEGGDYCASTPGKCCIPVRPFISDSKSYPPCAGLLFLSLSGHASLARTLTTFRS